MKKILYTIMALAVSLFSLQSCEDVPAPYDIPGIGGGNGGDESNVEPKGTGTLEDPYNVAAVVAYCKSLDADVESPNVVYIKGKVKNNTTTDATISSYGNMTFTMVDEGGSLEFTAFQVYGPGNKKFTSLDQIKQGDEVVVCGKVVNYKGNTPETVGKGAAYVYSINGEGGTSVPTEVIEISCEKAVELCNALGDGESSTEVYSITGYITDVFATVSKGQQSFWMADTKDGGKVLQAYWANLPEGVAAFKKGSKVKIVGSLLKYVKDGNVTTEVKNADVTILEEGSDDPTPDPTPGDVLTVAQAINAQGTNGGTVQGYIVAALKYGISNSNGDVADLEFSAPFTGYNAIFIADSPTETDPSKMLCAKLNDSESPADLKSKVNLKDNPSNLGKQLTLTGNLKACYTGLKGIRGITSYVLDGASSGGDNSTDVQTITIAQFNAAAESTSVWYQLTGTISNLKDGDSYGNFDLTDATGSVYVYGVLSEKGGAKKKFQELVSTYGLKNGSSITIIGNRGSYNGKIEVTNAYFVK